MGNGQVKALIFRRLETFSFILKALLVWKVLPEGTCREPGPAVPALAAFGVTCCWGLSQSCSWWVPWHHLSSFCTSQRQSFNRSVSCPLRGKLGFGSFFNCIFIFLYTLSGLIAQRLWTWRGGQLG